jgi:hypothetical protein
LLGAAQHTKRERRAAQAMGNPAARAA